MSEQNAINTASETVEEKLKAEDAVIEETNDILQGVASIGIIGGLMGQREKTGNLLKDNRNLIGGILGGAVAVGLELISPTGSKTSATVAAVASGLTLVATHRLMDCAPQTTALAATNAGVTCYVGMVAGRIAADYFPGNLADSE